MGSHRRFISSGSVDDPYMLPLESYGGWFDITTNLREEQKAGGTIKGWIDSLIGGFEQEDIAASPTVGGVNIHTGQPFAPSAAYPVPDVYRPSAGAGQGALPCAGYPSWVPDFVKKDILGCETVKPPPDWKKIAILASAVAATGLAFYAYPKIKARYAAPKKK